jgi:hypothetical protein
MSSMQWDTLVCSRLVLQLVLVPAQRRIRLG